MQATSSVIAYPGSCSGLGQTGNLLDLSYNFNYGSGDNGNVTGITNNRDTTRSQGFGYDALNRLLTAETTSTYSTSPSHCWGEAYIFDNNTTGSGAWGNLTNINPASTAYNGCNQETLSVTASAQNQISAGTYDTAGNLIYIPGAGGGTFTFDAENQMTQAATSSTTGYVYDGDGKRVEKTASGTPYKLYWYGVDGSILDETDQTGSPSNSNFSEYLYLGSQRIGRRDYSNNVFYYATDHLGTSRAMAEVPPGSTTATLCYDADFYPFGGERAYTTSCTQNYKFTGKERDSESNLDNFLARYDSSAMGRFMSPDWSNHPDALPYGDTSDPQSLNLYVYARNNPLVFVDSDGHCWQHFQSFCNWINFGVWVDNNHLEPALKRQADEMRKQLARQNISYKGVHLTSNYLKTLSNAAVFQLSERYNMDFDLGFVGIEVDRGGQVITSTNSHHLLPQAQEFRKYFDDADLDVDDYTMDIPTDLHRLIHSGQGTGRGGQWNNAWRQFFKDNPNASKEEILEQMNRMTQEFGLSRAAAEDDDIE